MKINQRVDGLNFIRIIAMMTILFYHALLFYGFKTPFEWLNEFFTYGQIFIIVFFMLSGFGLRKSNRTLNISDKQALKKYYINRIIAIYPIFILFQIVALIFRYGITKSPQEMLLLLPIQLSMLHILLGSSMHSFLFNNICWYLSALFVLYLLFPVLNGCLNKLSIRFKTILSVILLFVAELIYYYLVFYTDCAPLDIYQSPFLRIPEFVIGMLLADFTEVFIKPVKSLHASVIICVTILSTAYIFSRLHPYFEYNSNLYTFFVVICASVWIICISNWDKINQIGASKLIRGITSLGLEIYLCQGFTHLTMTRIEFSENLDVIYIVLSIIYAFLTHVFFTKPITKFLKKGRKEEWKHGIMK